MLSVDDLKQQTGKDIIKIPTYCSRDDWHNAYIPKKSIIRGVSENVDQSVTHLIMTAPTSDLTNVKQLDPTTRQMFADLSAKTLIATAEWALINYPGLQHVYIMEHLPR